MELLDYQDWLTSVDTFSDQLKLVANRYGFEKAVYMGGLVKPDRQLSKDMWESDPAYADSFPADWNELYHEQNYEQTDPVVHRAFTNKRPFLWDVADGELAGHSFLKLSSDFGLRRGLTVPIVQGRNELGLATFVSSDSTLCLRKHAVELAEKLVIITRIIHEKALEERRGSLRTSLELTPRETEVLSWVCCGKTNSEIAEILTLKEQSVSNYVYRLFSKFGVYNRTQLAYRALTLHVIEV